MRHKITTYSECIVCVCAWYAHICHRCGKKSPQTIYGEIAISMSLDQSFFLIKVIIDILSCFFFFCKSFQFSLHLHIGFGVLVRVPYLRQHFFFPASLSKYFVIWFWFSFLLHVCVFRKRANWKAINPKSVKRSKRHTINEYQPKREFQHDNQSRFFKKKKKMKKIKCEKRKWNNINIKQKKCSRHKPNEREKKTFKKKTEAKSYTSDIKSHIVKESNEGHVYYQHWMKESANEIASR